ncbi:MAG: HIT family protein [Acidimicrobiales bacterium]
MSGLDHIWAGWRMPYMDRGVERDGEGCLFCRLLESEEPEEATYILWKSRSCFAVLNAYPYTSGHLMVMPLRHVGAPGDLTPDEVVDLWSGINDGLGALKAAYEPAGANIGANLGRVAGAGVPGHFHMHVVPRWEGDANFMTTVAEARVLPESLAVTWRRLTDAWRRD